MSEGFQEILDGRVWHRPPPGRRHEDILARLHRTVDRCLGPASPARLLPPRTTISFSPRLLLCPDLALVTAAHGKLWLAAEVIDANDHRPDTVHKKNLYEEMGLPRLWMVDPRYDHIEVYHGGPHGLALQGMLVGRQVLSEKLLPGLHLVVAELFAAGAP
jgi:Uma2 family endonuclease